MTIDLVFLLFIITLLLYTSVFVVISLLCLMKKVSERRCWLVTNAGLVPTHGFRNLHNSVSAGAAQAAG